MFLYKKSPLSTKGFFIFNILKIPKKNRVLLLQFFLQSRININLKVLPLLV